MIDFITKSGSHYRVDLAARTVECIAPAESAFPARKALNLVGDIDSELPIIGRRYVVVWQEADSRGRDVMRTSHVVFIGEAGEALAL